MLLSAYRGISCPVDQGDSMSDGLQANLDRSIERIRFKHPRLDRILLRTVPDWSNNSQEFDSGARLFLKKCLMNGHDRVYGSGSVHGHQRAKPITGLEKANPKGVIWAKLDFLRRNRPTPYNWSGASYGRMSVAILVLDAEKYKRVQPYNTVYQQDSPILRRDALLGISLFDLSGDIFVPFYEHHQDLDPYNPMSILAARQLKELGFFTRG